MPADFFAGCGGARPRILASPGDRTPSALEQVADLHRAHSPYALAVSPDGALLALGTRNREAPRAFLKVRAIGATVGRPPAVILDTAVRAQAVYSVDFLAQDIVCAGCSDGMVRVYSIAPPQNQPVAEIQVASAKPVWALRSIGSRLLATYTADFPRALRVWDMDTLAAVQSIPIPPGTLKPASIPQLEYSPLHRRLFLCTCDGGFYGFAWQWALELDGNGSGEVHLAGAPELAPVPCEVSLGSVIGMAALADAVVTLSANGRSVIALDAVSGARIAECQSDLEIAWIEEISCTDFVAVHKDGTARRWTFVEDAFCPANVFAAPDLKSIAALPVSVQTARREEDRQRAREALLANARQEVERLAPEQFAEVGRELAAQGMVDEALLLLAENFRLHDMPLRELECRLAVVRGWEEAGVSGEASAAGQYYAIGDLLQKTLQEPALARHWYKRAADTNPGLLDARKRAENLESDKTLQDHPPTVRADLNTPELYAQELEKALVLGMPLPLRPVLDRAELEFPVELQGMRERAGELFDYLAGKTILAVAREETTLRTAPGQERSVNWILISRPKKPDSNDERQRERAPVSFAMEPEFDGAKVVLRIYRIFEGERVLEKHPDSDKAAHAALLADARMRAQQEHDQALAQYLGGEFRNWLGSMVHVQRF